LKESSADSGLIQKEIMKAKYFAPAALLAAFLTWPAIETYKLLAAQRQLDAALAEQTVMSEKLYAAKRHNVQVAKNDRPAPKTPPANR
jgi:hypothetical protein